MSPVDSLD